MNKGIYNREVPPETAVDWHAVNAGRVMEELGTSADGLSLKEAFQRLRLFGPNRLKKAYKPPEILTFLSQFRSPLIYILLVASLLSFIGRHIVDGTVILAIVMLNALIGYIQEHSAEKAIEALKKLAAPHATVIRDGEEVDIDASEITLGDLIVFEAGDRVPADGRLFEASNLKVDEAALTGESVPVQKEPGVLPADTPLADRWNMVYSGTMVSYGRGMAYVVATGMQTQIGQIAEQVSAEPPIVTPIQRKLSKLAAYLGAAGIGIATGIMVAGILRRIAILDVFFLGVAAAVSFIPEGLPAVVTIVLALGAQRMARNYSVIRKLSAVETLGSATVICSDKTGTLTRNQMTVRTAYTPDHSFTVTGEGYVPHGEFFEHSHKADRISHPDLEGLLTALALASDAHLHFSEDGRGVWSITGDPTEGALVVAAEKLGLKRHDLEELQPRIDEVPFDSNRRYMATLHRLPDGRKVVYVKGAAEHILSMCSTYWQGGRVRKLSGHALAGFVEQNTRMSSSAMRVLAAAFKEVPHDTENIEPKDVESDLTFIGAVGMIDPPREEAPSAIDAARDAGICVIMITGDHPDTARAIAGMLGLLDEGGQVVEGKFINFMTDDELNVAIRDIAVIARAEPQHKIRIIRALKSRGQIVAMTGDGVNDAPALKMADIGIAMGITGADVAKEASDMILLDDNFSTIVCAIEEGRNIFANIRRVTLYLLSTNSGEILVYILSILLGLPIPLLPVQILWVNLVTDGFNTVPLAFEPGEPDVLKRPPRPPDAPIIGRAMAFRIAFMALFMFFGTIGLYIWGLRHESLAEARTLAFAAIALFQIFNVLNVRSERYSIARIGLFSNPYVLLGTSISVLAQIAAIHTGFLQTVLGTVPLTLPQWALSAGVASSILWAEEVRKLIAGKRQRI